ncbi:hypothetical protein OG21DRAFT_1491847 [Imleria badia]|nr:hypothetical protein OG21DRAFT_1491847 [Imleria badia]
MAVTFGSVLIYPFDINSSPLQFLHILIGISFSDYVNIRIDTSIKWDSLNPDSKSDWSDSEHSNPEYDNNYSEYSDSELEEPQLVVIPRLEAPGSDVSLEEDDGASDPDGSAERDLEWKRTNLLGQGTTVWEGEVDSSPMNEHVMIKDSRTNPLRKYTEGMILHILEQHGIKGVPTLVGEQQVKTPLWDPTHLNTMVNHSTQFLLSVLPPNSPFQLRALSHLVSQPVGKLILEFSSIRELLIAFLDYTVSE